MNVGETPPTTMPSKGYTFYTHAFTRQPNNSYMPSHGILTTLITLARWHMGPITSIRHPSPTQGETLTQHIPYAPLTLTRLSFPPKGWGSPCHTQNRKLQQEHMNSQHKVNHNTPIHQNWNMIPQPYIEQHYNTPYCNYITENSHA